MELTEEQKERIRKNRERALETQKRRKLEAEEALSTKLESSGSPEEGSKDNASKRLKVGAHGTEEEDVVLEDFEVGASDFVTKKEAMKVYCLPEGTLAVCRFDEKQNPHRKGWTSMKLYSRAEIRRRARERFGGLEGLREERRKREEKRFLRDLDGKKNVFR